MLFGTQGRRRPGDRLLRPTLPSQPALLLHLIAALALAWRLSVRVPYPIGWDSVDFALSLDFFDLLRMQPHFPGYPVYVWLGRLARTAVDEPILALSTVSAVCGALAVYPIYHIGRAWFNARTGVIAAVLWSVNPLGMVLGVQPMSDAPGLLLFLSSLAALSSPVGSSRDVAALSSPAAAHRVNALHEASPGTCLFAGALFGALMGLRLSYWPVGLTLVALCPRRGRLPLIAGAVAGALPWLAWIHAQEGLDRYAALGWHFVLGHLYDWGGTPFSGDAGPLARSLERLRLLVGWNLGVAGLGLPRGGGDWARTLTGGSLAALGALGTWSLARNRNVARDRPADAGPAVRAALWWALPYLAWSWLGQNAANPRHIAPIIPLVCLFIAAGAAGHLFFKSSAAGPVRGAAGPGRGAWVIATCLLAATWWMSGSRLTIESATVPPPVVRLAEALDAAGDPARSAVFTWEEERVIEYLYPEWTAIRVHSPGYLAEAMRALPPGTERFVTSSVVNGFPAPERKAVLAHLKPVGRFQGDALLYGAYSDLTLYRWIDGGPAGREGA